MFARLALALGVLAPAFAAGAVSTVPASTVRPFDAPATRIAIAADFDGDGILDPAVLQGSVAEITLSKRHARVTLNALPHTTALAAVDIDHDGDMDLVSMADDGLRGWSNQQSGSFQQWTIGAPRAMEIAHMASVHWSAGAPVLPLAATGRVRTDAWDGALAAPAPELKPQTALALHAGRAPPRLIAFDRSSRAPPQIFIS